MTCLWFRVTSTDTIFYIDNVEVWRTPIPERAKGVPLYFLFQNGLKADWGIDLSRYNYGGDMYVDYVRVFEP